MPAISEMLPKSVGEPGVIEDDSCLRVL